MNLLQNKKQAKNFAFAVGLLSILGIGGFVASSATSQGATLSKFNQTAQVTTQTVSTLWTPSTDNPHRAKLINYGHAARTDAIIVLMLKKGLTLDKATFTTYLRNLQAGITSMANESTFKNDQEIQEIANYIAYEITDTTNVLNGRDIFFQRLNDLINQVQVNGTGSTGTGSTGTGSTGAANGSTEQLLSDLAALIQGTSPTIVTTTTTSTGTTTTTSGSGTGNVTEQLLGDLAALINGSTSTTATTGTTTTSTGSNDSTGSTSTGTTTASSGTTADLMNDLGALINNTGTEAANTNTQGTTASTSTSNGTTATVTTSADTTTTTSTATTGSNSTTATTGTSGSTTSTTTTNGTTTGTTGTTTSGTTGATTNNDQAGQLIDDLLRLIG